MRRRAFVLGGALADTLAGTLAGTMTITPVAAAAQVMPGGATPAADPHAGHRMDAPPAPAPAPTPSPAPAPAPAPALATDPHAGHDMGSMPAPAAAASPATDPHAGHDMSATVAGAEAIGTAPAPAPPTDHAADAIWGAAAVAPSRAALRREHGGFQGSMILFNLNEYQARAGADGYRWEGEGWFGGDVDRFVVKTEGEADLGGQLGNAEVQALFSRAIGPWWNLQAGIRYDIRPDPQRGFAALGIEGLAPYWFKASGAVFVSTRGEVLGRLEGFYDQRITQRLILQPRGEIDVSAQDIPALGIGAGLSDIELGLRLRYEIVREFAPYVGVEWTGKTGATARFARATGEPVTRVNYVAGIRFWF